MQAALLEAGEKVPPTRPALAVGEVDAQDLAAPFPVDADCNQDGLRMDHVIHPNFFVTRIEDQIGKRLLKPPTRKTRKFAVELLHNRGDR